MTDSETNPDKAISNERVCFDCGAPVNDPSIASCPVCSSGDLSDRHARPTHIAKRKTLTLPHPWSRLKLPPGATVLLSGGPGSGKTTICLKLKPTLYDTSEQSVQDVAASYHRVVGGGFSEVPLIGTISSWEELEEDVDGMTGKDIGVVDSISALAAPHHIAKIASKVITKVRRVGARLIFIAQYTKDGEMLGPNELRHLVDVTAEIPNDRTGQRRLAITKNRFGPLFTQYFELDADGVKEPEFPYAYSIEGPVGNYSLHMYPVKGSKYADIIDKLASLRVDIMGRASSAVECPAYPTGFAEPSDVAQRREFAEKHELEWITPMDAAELIQQSKEESF